MTVTSTTICEVQSGGSDSANSGGFDPLASFDGTLSATSATSASPVVSNSNYNFVAGDVGAWLFIKGGSNWTPGWYKIASVASNQATLDAAVGHAVLYPQLIPNTTAGCASVASPTSGTWAVDYSQQAAAQVTYTDLVIDGTANTKVTSAAHPFGQNHVGNVLNITGGTGFTVQRLTINSVTVNSANCNASLGTLSSTGGTGNLGGALASPGQAGAVTQGGNIFIKSGTYTIASTSNNVATGTLQLQGGNGQAVEGYGSLRGDLGTAPLLQVANTTGTLTVLSNGGVANNNGYRFVNLTVDGNQANGNTTTGFNVTRFGALHKCTAKNCSANGFNIGSSFGGYLSFCAATGCTTLPAFALQGTNVLFACEAYSNTATGFSSSNLTDRFDRCLSYLNSGASSDGFALNSEASALGCVAYGNGRDGFRIPNSNTQGNLLLANCIAEGNAGLDYNLQNGGSVSPLVILVNCASGPTSGTKFSLGTGGLPSHNVGFITQTAGSFFTNAAAGNLALNSTTGQGALLRAAGFPSTFPAGTTASFSDIGAAQHQDAGGGGLRIHPDMSGGFPA